MKCRSLARQALSLNDTSTTEIHTLSLHDALPISVAEGPRVPHRVAGRRLCDGAERHGLAGLHLRRRGRRLDGDRRVVAEADRSEEHTSELQSRREIVCRLLLGKEKELI